MKNLMTAALIAVLGAFSASGATSQKTNMDKGGGARWLEGSFTADVKTAKVSQIPLGETF